MIHLAELNGLTPAQLHEKIQQCYIGFSIENDGIQYLGREIQLKDGKVIVAEPESGEAFDHTEQHEADNHLIGSPMSRFKPLMVAAPEVVEFILIPGLNHEPFAVTMLETSNSQNVGT